VGGGLGWLWRASLGGKKSLSGRLAYVFPQPQKDAFNGFSIGFPLMVYSIFLIPFWLETVGYRSSVIDALVSDDFEFLLRLKVHTLLYVPIGISPLVLYFMLTKSEES